MLRSDDGPVRVLTISRPDRRNALNAALYADFSAALREADTDVSVRAVVVTGAGPVFCAGTDLAELAALAAGDAPTSVGEGFPALLDALSGIDVPLVAAVNGPAVGLGATMLPFFDLVFMSEEARLKAPFAAMGVPPEAASSYLFARLMGWQAAARLLLTGSWMSAADAAETGLASAVCAPGQLVPEAVRAAQEIAAHDRDATRSIKSLMRAGERDAIAAARRREDGAYARLLGKNDAHARLLGR
jgi:enoyl-CoA hydratase/carnithine racemase